MLRALTDSGTVLLEPIVRVTLSAGEEFLGKTIRDILQMRGEFDSPAVSKGVFTGALLPRRPPGISLAFRSMTSGQGLLLLRILPLPRMPAGARRHRKAAGIHPLLERSKWFFMRGVQL